MFLDLSLQTSHTKGKTMFMAAASLKKSPVQLTFEVAKTVNEMLDFCKVLRTIFSDSGTPGAFGTQFIWFISWDFALFRFLSCLYIVSLPKELASRLWQVQQNVNSLDCAVS